MTDETWKAIASICAVATPFLIFISKLLSTIEHRRNEKRVKKTNADVMEIKVFINGEMEKRLAEAKEQGRQEALNDSK